MKIINIPAAYEAAYLSSEEWQDEDTYLSMIADVTNTVTVNFGGES